MPSQSFFTEYELIKELITAGLLVGYSAENDPHNSTIDVNHSISNPKLIEYIKDLLVPDDYYEDEMNSANTLSVRFKVHDGIILNQITESLGGNGGDWGYEPDHLDLWHHQFNNLRDSLIELNAISEDQDLTLVIEIQNSESHLYYEVDEDLIEVPFANTVELSHKFISGYSTQPTEFRLCMWGDSGGSIEIQELTAEHSTDFVQNFDFSEEAVTPFTHLDLF